MRVRIGYLLDEWGKVYLNDGKIRIEGAPPEGGSFLGVQLESMGRPGMDDTTLFKSLPLRLRDRTWCSKIENDDGTPLADGRLAGGEWPPGWRERIVGHVPQDPPGEQQEPPKSHFRR